MNSLGNTDTNAETELNRAGTGAVLAREAGVPFQPPLTQVDPFTEWLSLMEVVQMLCPTWPVRDRPMQGKTWRL